MTDLESKLFYHGLKLVKKLDDNLYDLKKKYKRGIILYNTETDTVFIKIDKYILLDCNVIQVYTDQFLKPDFFDYNFKLLSEVEVKRRELKCLRLKKLEELLFN